MNDNVTQELAPEDDPKNYLPRQDGRPDLTFCEMLCGYPEDILVGILRKENAPKEIIEEVEKDEAYKLTVEQTDHIVEIVSKAEEEGRIPADLVMLAKYTLFIRCYAGEKLLKKLVGYGYNETIKALDEYRRNPQLRIDHTILFSPERLTPLEKAKIRTVLAFYYGFDSKPELREEYAEGYAKAEGLQKDFRRVPIWARDIFDEVGLEEGTDNWDKMPVSDYAWLMMEVSRIIPGFDVPISKEDCQEAGMDIDVAGEDEMPFEEFAEELKGFDEEDD